MEHLRIRYFIIKLLILNKILINQTNDSCPTFTTHYLTKNIYSHLQSCSIYQISVNMSKSGCIGCKTHFEEGEKLPLEGICVELKNYPLPIKDQSHKYKLLRTIVSFLNSKGGTIFIGAQDETGEIKGVSIQRKQQDDFRIFIQQLTDRIQPKIDLSDREDILTQFVPIFNKGKFTGKHLVKILVKQGDPSELYCFSKKIQLQGINDKKVDQYEIVCSFKRLNAGNIQQIKAFQLIKEVKAKATKPSIIHKTFHDDCNPEPLAASLDILKIGFSNIVKENTRQILLQWFEITLQQLKVTTSFIGYDQANSMIVIEFQEKSQFNIAQTYVSKNINELNRNLDGICCFQRKDKFLDCILYQNKLKQNNEKIIKNQTKKKTFIKKSKEEKQTDKNSDTKEQPKAEKTQGKVQQSEQQVVQKEENHDKQEVPQKKKWVKVQKKEEKQDEKIEQVNKNVPVKVKQQIKKQKVEKITEVTPQKQVKNFSRKYSLTFTHINPKTKNQLRNFIDRKVKCKKNFQMYENTVQVFLPTFDMWQEMYENIFQEPGELNQYGFKNDMRFGVNTGLIQIINFDKTKSKQLLGYLKNQMGKDMKAGQAMREGGGYLIRMILNKQDACIWLDRLLVDKYIKTFQIPGAQQNQKPKMKIFLQCAQQDEQIEQILFM